MTKNKRLAINLKRRGLSSTIRSGVLARGRLTARAKQQQKQLVSKEQAAFNKTINDINSGRITRVSQIPTRFRGMINVSQQQLNQINAFTKQQGDIKLWDEAYKLADRVLSSKRPGAIFAIGFSKNPYAKTAYKNLKENRAAFKQRQKIISNIRKGKITNVKVSGNRIVDLDTNRPITPAVASNKQFFLQAQKDLPKGETLLRDARYNITGIKSNALKQSLAFTPTNIKFYNRKINEVPKFNFKKEAERLKKERLAPSVQAVEQPKGFVARTIKKLNDLQRKRSTASIRGQQKKLSNELQLMGLTVATTIIGGVSAIIALPKTAVSVAKNPSQLKRVPSAIKEGGTAFGQLIRVSPTEAFAKVGGELLFLKGSGKAFRVVGKVGGSTANKINPFLKRVKNNRVTIKTTRGKTTLEVGLIGKGVPLKKQAKLAGKKLEVAASVQADKIINRFRNRQRTIRKPIPGEESLSARTKLLLDKFDKDKITKKQFMILNKRLIKETGDKTLLERSLFLDPKGKIRFTRLSDEAPDAGIIDILSGDFTLRSPKPQILVFTNTPVARFPSTLRDVARKLKRGKPLNLDERIRLVEWQLKRSGKFKPIGDIKYRGGVELEVTIAPGELIKRRKKLGAVLVKGKKVEVIEAEIFKPKAPLRRAIARANKGLLNKKQLRALERRIEKETKIKSRFISRRGRGGRPRARLPKRITRVDRPKKKRVVAKRPPAKRKKARPPVKRKKVVRKRAPPKRPTRKKPPIRKKGRGGPKPPRPPRTPRTGKPPARPPITSRTKSRVLKKPTGTIPSYDVYIKKGKRFFKQNKVPIKLNQARDLMAYRLDTTLSRTGEIRPLGKVKRTGVIPKQAKGYYSKNRRKLRAFKKKRGKRVSLELRWIEKKKFALDKRKERRQLKRVKKKVVKRKPVKKKVVKRRVRRKPRKK